MELLQDDHVAALAWIAINQKTISSQEGGVPFNLDTFLSEKGLSIPNGFGHTSVGFNSNPNFPYQFQVGYIQTAGGNEDIFVGGNFCMLDGEGGPGGLFQEAELIQKIPSTKPSCTSKVLLP